MFKSVQEMVGKINQKISSDKNIIQKEKKIKDNENDKILNKKHKREKQKEDDTLDNETKKTENPENLEYIFELTSDSKSYFSFDNKIFAFSDSFLNLICVLCSNSLISNLSISSCVLIKLISFFHILN